MTTVNLIIIALPLIIFSGIFFVIFGQVIVRKLRKNPDVSPYLGVSFVQGWDIINVAYALALPKWIVKKTNGNFRNSLSGDYDVLHKHVNKIDVFLARVFFYCLNLSGVIIIFAVILSELNIID